MNFRKTSVGSYLGSKTEEEKKYFLDLAQNFFSFRVIPGLRGKIVPPPIMAQSEKFFGKNFSYLRHLFEYIGTQFPPPSSLL